jgi:hypothetical protein
MAIRSDPKMLDAAKAYYANGADGLVAFVNDCVWVTEPRNANKGEPTRIPVVTFPRQADFLRWMVERFETHTSAPVEKSRDSGATWMAAAFSVWLWLFYPGSSIGFGSRKEMLVDRSGDMNSIFGKVRAIIDQLPRYLVPIGWNPKSHSNYMKIMNPENEATIIGEAGNNIGRGGRTSVYIIDEAAFLENPHLVEAALTANTDCRIDISSPRIGTLFNEWCATSTLKFIFDVHEIPWHSREWMAQKQHDLESKGMGHLYAQEYLRDGSAGIEGQLIPAKWVDAAIDADLILGLPVRGAKTASLDVADGGQDRSAFAYAHGLRIEDVRTRGDCTADVAGTWGHGLALQMGCATLRYDSIGVGAGAGAMIKHKRDVICTGWNASGAVVDPTQFVEGTKTKNEDFFANAKSQAWWNLRTCFHETFKAVHEKRPYDVEKIISLSSKISELRELKTELSQVTYKHNQAGLVLINKQPDGTRSPNRADSVMICRAPWNRGVQVLGMY